MSQHKVSLDFVRNLLLVRSEESLRILRMIKFKFVGVYIALRKCLLACSATSGKNTPLFRCNIFGKWLSATERVLSISHLSALHMVDSVGDFPLVCRQPKGWRVGALRAWSFTYHEASTLHLVARVPQGRHCNSSFVPDCG